MGDLLSDREMAEKLQAAIVSLVDGSLSSFTVGGTTYTKLSLEGLQKLYDYYAARASRRRHGIVSHLDFRGNVEDRQ